LFLDECINIGDKQLMKKRVLKKWLNRAYWFGRIKPGHWSEKQQNEWTKLHKRLLRVTEEYVITDAFFSGEDDRIIEEAMNSLQ